MPCTEWQRPTCRIWGNLAPMAQVLMAMGFTYWSMMACGQTSIMSSQMLHRWGTVRKPRMMPPTPSVSAMVWRRPTRFGTSKSVTVAGSKPPIWKLTTTKSAPSSARRWSEKVSTVAWASMLLASLDTTTSDSSRRRGLMSMSRMQRGAVQDVARDVLGEDGGARPDEGDGGHGWLLTAQGSRCGRWSPPR